MTAKTNKPKKLTFDSMQSCAAGLRLPLRIVKAAKGAGCPAFSSNRVFGDELLEWLNKHPEIFNISADPRDEKIREEIRKLKIANDAKEGALVSRAWVAERMQRTAGEVNALRIKSEAEHPKRFAAAAGDIAACRSIVRGVWDDIFLNLQALSTHFSE